MARRNTVIGLDLGRYSVKAVWAELRGGKPFITRAESFRLPAAGMDPMTVLKPWLEEKGIPGQRCAIGIPGAHTMFQPFLLPPGDPRTCEQAAAMEVVRFNELASEAMHYGFTPFSFQAGEKRILLAMTRQQLLQDLLAQGESLGLDVVEVTPAPVAAFNALESAQPPHEEPFLFIDVGASGTLLAAGSAAHGLLFARTFSSGGQMFTDAIARARKCPSAQAENVKLRQEGGLETAEAEVAAALASAADIWITEAQACLSVYQNLFSERKARPAKVLLCGGGAQLAGFPELVARRLNLPAARADRFPPMRNVEEPWLFANAAGLAMSALGAVPARLTMLPEPMRDDLTFREQKPFWIAAAVTGALILAVSLGGGFRDYKRKEKLLGEQKSSLRRRGELAGEIDAIKASTDNINAMAAPAFDMLRAGPTVREVISLVADNKTTNDWITMICDAESYFNEAPLADLVPDRRKARKVGRAKEPADASLVPTRLTSVIIEGYTRREDLSTIKALIEGLKRAPTVAFADLLGEEMLNQSPTLPPVDSIYYGAQRFVIKVDVRQP